MVRRYYTLSSLFCWPFIPFWQTHQGRNQKIEISVNCYTNVTPTHLHLSTWLVPSETGIKWVAFHTHKRARCWLDHEVMTLWRKLFNLKFSSHRCLKRWQTRVKHFNYMNTFSWDAYPICLKTLFKHVSFLSVLSNFKLFQKLGTYQLYQDKTLTRNISDGTWMYFECNVSILLHQYHTRTLCYAVKCSAMVHLYVCSPLLGNYMESRQG